MIGLILRRGLPVAVGLFLVATAQPVSAQTFTWQGSTSTWGTSTNWNPNGIPNANSATAVFTGTGSTSVDVNGAFTIGTLRFSPGSGVFTNYNFFASNNGALTFNNGASASVIESLPGGAGGEFIDVSLSVPIVIGGNNQLHINNGGTVGLQISGAVSGAGGSVTINAGGQGGVVSLFGTNTYGGTTTVAGGTLQAHVSGSGLPNNSPLVLNGGVFETIVDSSFTRALGAGSGEVRLVGTRAGFSAVNGTLTVNLGGSGAAVTWGSTHFNPTTLVLGNPVENSRVIWENGIDLGGAARTISAEAFGFGNQSFARISGVVSGSATSALTKTGNGVLELTAANTYTGTTIITGGFLRANHGTGLPATSPLIINVGTTGGFAGGLEGSGTFSRTIGAGAGQIRLVSGGFSASGGTLTVQLNGGTGTLTWNTTNFLTQGPLMLGSQFSDALVDFQNGLALGNTQREVWVDGNPDSPNARARISGPISGTAGGGLWVRGNGAAVLELTGTNTYPGQTRVEAGALRANHGQGLPATSPLLLNSAGVLESLGTVTFSRNLGTGAGQVALGEFSGGFSASGGVMTVRLNNNVTTPIAWGGANFLPNGGSLVLGSVSANNLVDFQNSLNLGGVPQTVLVNDNKFVLTDIARISGVLSNGGLTKEGDGVLELTAANTYTLPTIVSAGVLRANHGVGLPASSPLLLDTGGVLEGIGTVTFTRSLGTGAGQVAIGASGGGFSASGGVMTVNLGGAGATVTWGSANFIPSSFGSLVLGSPVSDNLVDFQNGLNLGAANRDVYVYGGQARISGVITSGGLWKFGPGTLELTNANTHNISTVVREGRLLVNNTTGSATGTGWVEVGDGATLGGGGRIVGTSDFTATFGSRLDPGGSAGRTLRIQTSPGGVMTFSGTWVVRINATGPAGVAGNSGGSTTGTVTGSNPDPVNHTFLDLSVNGLQGEAWFNSISTWEIDGTGLTFDPNQVYSYVIGRAGPGEVDLDGETVVTDQTRFTAVGFAGSSHTFSVTTNASGQIILNIAPVPEPITVLGLAAAGLSLGALVRRRLRK